MLASFVFSGGCDRGLTNTVKFLYLLYKLYLMIYRLIFAICLFSGIGCTQEQSFKEYDIPPPHENYLDKNSDTQRHALFAFDKKRDSYIFNKTYNPATLSKDELNEIEKLISKKVKEYNLTSKWEWSRIKQPNKYYKQFIAATNSNGEKEVWINCCCSVMKEYWKTHIADVNDGGSCFFQVKINLTTRKILHFGVNGEA